MRNHFSPITLYEITGSEVIFPDCFKPLLTEFCFPSIFKIEPLMGSYRLPTRRRDAHSKYIP